MPAGAIALLLASLIYTAYGPMARVMAETFSPPLQVVFRAVVALVPLAAVIAVRGLRLGITRRQLWRAVTLGVTFTLTGLLYTIAVTNTKLSNAIFVFLALGPVSSVVLARMLFGERIGRKLLIAIFLTLAGILAITRPDATIDIGVAAAIGAGLTSGFSNITRRWLKGVNWAIVLFYQYLVTVVVGTVIAVADPAEAFHAVSAWPIFIGVVYALASVAVNALLLYGYSHIDVGTGSLILSTELIFIIVLGWAAYSEVPTPVEWMGCALISLGTVYAVRAKRTTKVLTD